MDTYSHLAPDAGDEIAKLLESTMPNIAERKKNKVLLFRKPR